MRTAILTTLILAYPLHAEPKRAGRFSIREARCTSPADAVLAAADDLEEVPEASRTRTRYLWDHSKDDKYRESVAAPVIAYHLNALSREPELIAPVSVNGTASSLWRINLDDYGIDPATFAKLAGEDPFFHLRANVPLQGKPKLAKGDLQSLGRIKSSDALVKVRQRVDHAPWLSESEAGKNALARLAGMTGSVCPIVNAQWFFTRSAIQDGRAGTGYYDFLKLGKKEADFLEIGGGDLVKQKALALKLDTGAVVVDSHKVAINNRQIRRVNMLNGSLWFTLDVKTSVGKQNAVRHLDELTPDGSEQILTLPNGLPAFWLQDGQGNRVDSVPPDIANNTIATGKDTRVHANLTCVRCHHVLHPIDDHIRKSFSSVVQLNVADARKQRRIRQLYFSNLQEQFDADLSAYAKRVKQITGLEMGAFVIAYGKYWDDWVERTWEPARIAELAGLKESELLDQLKATKPLDLVLAGLLNVPPVPLRHDQMEEVFPVIMLTRAKAMASRNAPAWFSMAGK